MSDDRGGDARARDVLEPVGWLLGPDLIRALRKIGGKRHEPRDWMAHFPGFLHDEALFRDGRFIELHAEPGKQPAPPDQDALQVPMGLGFGGPPAAPPAARSEADEVGAVEGTARAIYPDEADEVWFDFIADMGDSSDAMYAIAYACQIGLDRGGGDELVRATGPGQLPRGQFLMVGGDTAYHVADQLTIFDRVQQPFRWAAHDLGIADDAPEQWRIYGIPGNHDWYDDLRGFARVFRRGDNANAIKLPGFQRLQLGSYAAIRLPHGWRLWGLDIDQGLDVRQQQYFDSLRTDTRQLILCTPSPPVAFHAAIPTEPHTDAMEKLGLPRAYEAGVPLPADHARLDLSGDIHHYARYPSPRTVDRDRYLCVVSGLGGAFHHPSFTRVGAREAAAMYPAPEVSRRHVADGLLHPLSTLKGSWIRGFPILFALILGFAAIVGGGATWAIGHALGWLPGFADVSARGDRRELGHAAAQLGVLVAAGILGYLAVRAFNHAYDAGLTRARGRDENATQPARRRRGFWIPTVLMVAAVALVVLFPQCPLAPAARTAGLDVGAIVLFLVALLAGPIVAVKFGDSHTRGVRPGMVLLGLAHSLALVSTPLLCGLLVAASLRGLAMGLALPPVTWALLVATRRPFKAGRIAGVAMIALVAWLGGMAALVHAAGGHAVAPGTGWAEALGRIFVGALVAMLLDTAYFAWYLAIAALGNAHNNEAGGGARVKAFRQFIRFRVHAGGVTGHVIKVEGDDPARKAGASLTFTQIDEFTVAPPA